MNVAARDLLAALLHVLTEVLHGEEDVVLCLYIYIYIYTHTDIYIYIYRCCLLIIRYAYALLL